LPGRDHEKVIAGTEAMKHASNSESEALGLRQIRSSFGG
jgi:hypothetical protein